MTVRVITGVILLALCIAAMFLLPNAWWAAAVLAVVVRAGWEWGALAGYGVAARWTFCGAILISGIAIYAGTVMAARVELAVYAAGCVFWVLIAPAWLARGWRVRSPLAAAAAGWIVLVPAWLAMARLQSDPLQLLQFMGIVWLADTAALMVGKSWGKRKLAPQISPGKTWEGVVGASAAVAVYYVVLLGLAPTHPWLARWGWLVFAGVAVLSVIGDLFESWMKRQAGVKDSGALLPGHGGILDRIDGLTAGMPLAALLTSYLD